MVIVYGCVVSRLFRVSECRYLKEGSPWILAECHGRFLNLIESIVTTCYITLKTKMYVHLEQHITVT